MTNSYRRRPFAAYCGGSHASQKDDKRICNRVMRRANRVRLAVHRDERPFMNVREAYNEYNWAQDGTRHYAPYPNLLRYMSYREWWRWAKAK